MIAKFATLKQMIRSGQKSHKAIQVFNAEVREDYVAQTGSLRLVNDLNSATSKLIGEYSERDYAEAPEAYDALFDRVDALLVEAEAAIALREAQDILDEAYSDQHPDAEYD